MLEPESTDHKQNRTIIRSIGAILTVVGGMMFLKGISFLFSLTTAGPMEMAMNGGTTFIWAVFGLPLTGLGLQLLLVGYIGKIARYQANEMGPVGKDTLNYVARETKGSVQNLAEAIGAGLRGESPNAERMTRTCHRCGNNASSDDSFCDQCGASLAEQSACPACHAPHEADARFCSSCGNSLPSL